MQGDKEGRICELLEQVPTDGLGAVRRLLCVELGFDSVHETLPRPPVPDWARSGLVGPPIVIAGFRSPAGSFEVIHARLQSSQDGWSCSHAPSVEAWLVGELLGKYPFSLFVFCNEDEQYWRFVNVPFASKPARRQIHRRLQIGPHEPPGMAARCLALIDLTEPPSPQSSLSPMLIQQSLDRAFDPRAIADRFYQECEGIFFDLLAELRGQTADHRWPRVYALKLLTRLLFVCIVQRTGLLAGDPRFLSNLWQAYLQTGRNGDAFVRDWLDEALFGTLSRVAPSRRALGRHLPAQVRRLLASLPRLGGGLLDQRQEPLQDLEPTHRLVVSDACFERILAFLESYAFTSREDTALNQQLAIGPVMLGRLYEGLANESRERTRGIEAGIYYTSPTEVEFMSRLALGDWLANHLGSEHRFPLLQSALASGPRARQMSDSALVDCGLWPHIKRLLDGVTILDPACGSGSFLVGMYQVLDDLLARANRQVGLRVSAAERKRRIATASLHGVDLDGWVVEIARSRLWLQLLEDAAGSTARPELDLQLPHLGSKIVCGESLLLGQGQGELAWEDAFAAVLAGERPGFDLVIGNPPYVRQELIEDPNRARTGDRTRYRTRLARAVYAVWPRTFGYDAAQDRALRKLDARSDLYIYFFFQGLSLLHAQGTLCFVTSNSWLDARYGRVLRRFLLTQGQVKLLIDNQASRSFERAQVNTVIALLGAACDADTSRPQSLQHILRFVMLQIPFEQAFEAATWERILSTPGRRRTPDFRVLARTQAQLLNDGLGPKRARHRGDRWGSKYLRAPDIYWRLQEEYGSRLVRLKDIAVVKRGITTGANDFFFLDEKALARWGIEEQYLAPALKSPRGCHRIWVEPDRDVGHFLFLCHRERGELENSRALAYIEHGEARGLDQRPTCRRRSRWWDLGLLHTGARVYCNYLVDRVMRFYGGDGPFLASDSFQAIHCELAPEALIAACNSTVCQLSANVLGRSNFGGGLLKLQTYEVGDLLIPDPRLLDAEVKEIIRNAGLLALDDPQRHVLDEMVADALGLVPADWEAIYTAVSSMVTARIAKAQSLTRP